ncbi:MAG: cohesin domain-containing protein [Candidatus Saccharimonadales bacterium]
MKKLFYKIIQTTAVLAIILIPTNAFAAVGSGGANISVSSASANVGNEVKISINETSSVGVAGVEADFTYDASMLSCNSSSINVSASGFGQSYPSSCGNGSLKIARATSSGTVSGTQNIATVTFTALRSGVARLVVAESSEIDDISVSNACGSSCASGSIASTITVSNTPTTPPSNPTAPVAPTNGGTTTATTPSKSTSSTPTSSTSTSTKSNATPVTGSTSTTGQATAQDGTMSMNETQTAAKTDNKIAAAPVQATKNFNLIPVVIAALIALAVGTWYILSQRNKAALAASAAAAVAATKASKKPNTKKAKTVKKTK